MASSHAPDPSLYPSLSPPASLLPSPSSLPSLLPHNNVAIFQPPPPDLPPLEFDPPVADDLLFQQPQLSAPTMHPNLVSTLRLIISPLSSAESLGRLETLDDAPLLARPKDCSVHVSGHGPDGDLPDDRCLNLGAHKLQPTLAGSVTQGEDQSQAAIVPIDLIQNKRPFRCASPGCNKTFKNPQTLKMHNKTHFSENSAHSKGEHFPAVFPPYCRAGHNKKIPSKCPVCRRTFVGLYELRRHFGRKHSEGEKSHGCKKCGKKFYIEVDLRDHEKLCGEPLECSCGMKFAFKCNLVAHKKSHPDCQELSGEEEAGTAGTRAVARAQPSFKSSRFMPGSPSLEAVHTSLQNTATASTPSFLALGQPAASCSLSSIPPDTLLKTISCGIWPSHV